MGGPKETQLVTEKPGMGWLRLVGSLELQVSFAEYGLFKRALLQKRHIILRSLLVIATPYEKGLQGLLANHGRTSRMYVEKTSLTAHVNQSCLMCE